MRIRPVIRHPRIDESLSPLFGPYLEKFRWNYNEVWVADWKGELVAGCIVWDSGHDFVHVDNLIVKEDFRTCGVAKHLLDNLIKDLKDRGRKVILSETQSVEVAYWAKKRGCKVSTPTHMMMMEID